MDIEALKEFVAETQAMSDPALQRVVCAAVRMSDGVIFTGIRHFSPDMHLVITLAGYNEDKKIGAEQGFVDQWGKYLTRQEAFDIALRNGQYRPYPPFTFGTLYSEDLY